MLETSLNFTSYVPDPTLHTAFLLRLECRRVESMVLSVPIFPQAHTAKILRIVKMFMSITEDNYIEEKRNCVYLLL